MTTDRMNQLVIMVNLCSSVVEGIEHLMSNWKNERLKEDAVSGLMTLVGSLKEMQADKAVIHETRWMAKVIKNWLFVYDREFKDRLYRWYFSALKEIRNLMTEELETCPVCGGKGKPHYGAAVYMEGGTKEESVLKPVRVYMKCRECRNYYLAKEEGGFFKGKKGHRRTKAGCQRLLAELGTFCTEGAMLFIGGERSQLYIEAEKAGYVLKAIALEEAFHRKDMETYSVVVLEELPKTRDIKAVLMGAAEYLAEGGILWFDGLDLERFLGSLEKKGTSIWKREAQEVCFTKDGVNMLVQACGLCVQSYRRVGTANGRIEVIAKKLV
ncbi:hypothetical protein [Lacrimispora sp. JR3]|uniref:hypothetical protein n=1 Tax=Lacrimispora sinapis TaxID=3111456 RepID=UPI003748B8F9